MLVHSNPERGWRNFHHFTERIHKTKCYRNSSAVENFFIYRSCVVEEGRRRKAASYVDILLQRERRRNTQRHRPQKPKWYRREVQDEASCHHIRVELTDDLFRFRLQLHPPHIFHTWSSESERQRGPIKNWLRKGKHC